MKREINLEQFFTSKENALFCLSKININDFETIIEPSAGNGSFSSLINNCLAYDIEPQSKEIIKQDFLELDCSVFSPNTLVIGNPPFGRQSSLAIKFINKASFARKIAFILPNSFKKESMINKLEKHLFLENVFQLPNNTFFFNGEKINIPCSFFIFEKREKIRIKEELPVVTDFSFVKKEEADCSIRRVGFYAGKIESLDVCENSHYFIKWNTKDAMYNYLKLKFDFNNTVGARSLSKTEIIKKYYTTYIAEK